MCRMCGSRVGAKTAETVRTGAGRKTVCRQCRTKDVPMLQRTPGGALEVTRDVR